MYMYIYTYTYARASSLLSHELITSTCSGIPVHTKYAEVASWLGDVRSCFTSGNIASSAASFKPKNLAMDFINFYLGKEIVYKAAPS